VGGSRPSPIHGPAQVPLAEGVGDRAPEALERPATHAGDIERAERVLQQLRLKIAPGLRRATLALEPANLGRITIALQVRDGRLEAVLRAEKVETLGVLEAHMPELRAMLEQSGIDAKNIDLGLGSEDDAPGADTSASDGSGSNAGGAAHDPFDLEDTDTFGASRLAQAITDELGVDIYA
jgi:flagellar hook-length control protein FliK